MRIRLTYLACALLLPCAAAAATRSYPVGEFDKVSVAAGIQLDITPGSVRGVVANTRAEHFEDLKIIVKGGELRISRPVRNWFWFRRPNYNVQVVMPVLRGLDASSGSQVMVKGAFTGDFALASSSGSRMRCFKPPRARACRRSSGRGREARAPSVPACARSTFRCRAGACRRRPWTARPPAAETDRN